MSSLMDKLDHTAAVKEDIRRAINTLNGSQVVSTSTPFDQYKNYINLNNIPYTKGRAILCQGGDLNDNFYQGHEQSLFVTGHYMDYTWDSDVLNFLQSKEYDTISVFDYDLDDTPEDGEEWFEDPMNKHYQSYLANYDYITLMADISIPSDSLSRNQGSFYFNGTTVTKHSYSRNYNYGITGINITENRIDFIVNQNVSNYFDWRFIPNNHIYVLLLTQGSFY